MSEEPGEIVVEDGVLREGFTQVPNGILRDPNLSVGAKLAYATLLSYAWQKDRCFPGQGTMATDMGVSEDSVNRYLKELVEKGFISAKRRGLKLTNLYTILARTRKSQNPEISGSRNLDLRVQEPDICGTNNTQIKKTQKKKTQSPYNPPTREENATPIQQPRKPTTQSDSGSRKEPQARSSAASAPTLPPALLRFVNLYPERLRLARSSDLLTAWQIATSEATEEQLFNALEKYKASWKWTKNGGQYILGIIRWLSEGWWKIEPEPAPNLAPGQPGYVHPKEKLGIWGKDF
jgi:DNA-binding transcriptional regulator YhcF (GntR family)